MWLILMILWWVAGLIGLVLSLALLRVAVLRRRHIDRRQVLAHGLATRLVRSASERSLFFGFIWFNAPIVYRMFNVAPNTGIRDPTTSSLPFGMIAVAGTVVVVVTAFSLVILFYDLRDLLKR